MEAGAGKDLNYVETYQGKLIDSKGANGRYVRLYINGNTTKEQLIERYYVGRLKCGASLPESSRPGSALMGSAAKGSHWARWVAFIIVALIGLAIRLPKLDARPMHTDEAVNAYIVGQLLTGEPFTYDACDRHGPALAALTLPMVRVQRAKSFSDLTESGLRIVPVVAGTITILLFGAAVELFGFIPSLLAAILFAVVCCPFTTTGISSMNRCLRGDVRAGSDGLARGDDAHRSPGSARGRMCCSHAGLQGDGAASLFALAVAAISVRAQRPARIWPNAMDSAEVDSCCGPFLSIDRRRFIYLVWQKLESPAHALARGSQPFCAGGRSRSREALLVFRPASRWWLVWWTARRHCLPWALHEL